MIKKYPITVRPSYLSKTKITIHGEWFNFLTNYGIFLSANKPELNTEIIDLYSEDPKLIVANPPFYGITILNYNVLSNNIVEFYLPDSLISANYDIIVCNPAGYTKATSQIALNVLKVVGVFEFKEFTSLSGSRITSIENIGIQTIRKQFLFDFVPAISVTLNNENEVVSLNGDNIVTIERFLASN